MIDLSKLKEVLIFTSKPRSAKPNKVLDLRITVEQKRLHDQRVVVGHRRRRTRPTRRPEVRPPGGEPGRHPRHARAAPR